MSARRLYLGVKGASNDADARANSLMGICLTQPAPAATITHTAFRSVPSPAAPHTPSLNSSHTLLTFPVANTPTISFALTTTASSTTPNGPPCPKKAPSIRQ